MSRSKQIRLEEFGGMKFVTLTQLPLSLLLRFLGEIARRNHDQTYNRQNVLSVTFDGPVKKVTASPTVPWAERQSE